VDSATLETAMCSEFAHPLLFRVHQEMVSTAPITKSSVGIWGEENAPTALPPQSNGNTIFWSIGHKTNDVCWAKFGTDPDELWFKGTLGAVYYVNKTATVFYDNGKVEIEKPFNRIRVQRQFFCGSKDSDSESDEAPYEAQDAGELAQPTA